MSAPPSETLSNRRPTEEAAREAIESYLEMRLGMVPRYWLCEDGDDTSADGKCGWAFWILQDDTTSYVHEDLLIEWYGTAYDPDFEDEDE